MINATCIESPGFSSSGLIAIPWSVTSRLGVRSGGRVSAISAWTIVVFPSVSKPIGPSKSVVEMGRPPLFVISTIVE